VLSHVRQLGGHVSVVDGRLQVNCPKGTLTPGLRDDLSRHKAEILELLGLSRAGAQVPAPRVVPRNEVLPLSFAQQRLWFLQQLIPDNTSYNVSFAFRIRGALDRAALERALGLLVERHEILRTTFRDGSEGPVQVIAPATPITLPLAELEPGSGEPPLRAARNAAWAEARRPYDLARELPLRVRLWRLSDDDHVLLVVIHHICVDAWSMGIFWNELAALYDACRQGTAADLTELPIQYADYAHWQHQWLQGEALEQLLQSWSTQLAGMEPLDLPLDRTRPAHQTFNGAVERITLDAALTSSLERLGQQAGCSFFMTMLAGFVALLQRYTRQDDIAVGTPAIHRGRAEFEGLLGCFLNMLVLRTDVSGDPTLRELLKRVQTTTLDGLRHQGLPFERLVEELVPERDPSRNPLFQVFFTVINEPNSAVQLPGLSSERLDMESQRTNFDLSVQLTRVDDGVKVAFAYNTDLFDAETVRAMIGAYSALLELMLQAPDAPIASLSLLNDGERDRLLAASGEQTRAHAAHRIDELFARQVERTPSAIAVGFEGEQLSYLELDQQARRLASVLRQRGVGPGVLVGLCVERGPDLLVGTLGILQAGGAYVPLDPALPMERLQFMLADTAAPVLVTQAQLQDGLPEHDGAVVLIDAQPEAAVTTPPAARDAGPDDLAYVIFTSGSTGRPKGVQVRHAGVVNFLESMALEPGLGPDDALLAVTTLSFDIAALELFLPLSVGARVEIASRETASDGVLLQRALVEREITVMQATPATWQTLIHAGWEGDGKLKMLCGGEELPRPLAEALLSRGGALFNLYGPTETTIWSAVTRVTTAAADEAVSIGHPIAQTQLLVLDEQLRPVPQGVPGELHISGAGLARGYLNQPELTQQRFVPSPWPERIPGRLYKTGDLTRMDGRGRLRFLGRLDHQVKLRGYRIELGEIEAALSDHPAVLQAAALVREDAPGDRRLVAYVTPSGEAAPTSAELRDMLRARLPEYMLPSAFVVQEALPLSPAGKIDRRQLAALDAPQIDERSDRTAPRGPTEEAIAGAFRHLLGRTDLGVHDDFFELGGHSLLATQLVSRLRLVLQVELPLSVVFDAPTVAGLAKHVAEQRSGPGRATLAQITPVPRDGGTLLSFAQRRLWVLDQVGTGAAYHMQIVLDLSGPLDLSLLELALADMIARHEVLRTRYEAIDGDPRQFVQDPFPLPMPLVDRRDVAHEARDAALQELIARDEGQPFDLARGSVLRTSLVQFDAEEHTLIVTIHHIVADGWSIALISREVASLYRARLTGDAHGLPELPVQFADYSAWQRSGMTGKTLEDLLAYWTQRLAGDLPVLALSTDHPRPATQTFSGASQRFAIDPDIAQALVSLSHEQGVTMATMCLAAFQLLLGRFCRQDEFLLGSPVAGRSRTEIESLIGLFVNSVVLRADLSGDPPFSDLLQRVHRTALEAYDHQDLPFETLVDELAPERDPSRSPLFQVVFVMQYGAQARVDVPDLDIRPRAFEISSTRHDLELYIFDRPSGLSGRLVYNTDLFDASTIERMAGHLQTLLAGIVASPDAHLSQLPLLTPDQREHLGADWNSTEVEDLDQGCIHERVAARAAEQPDAVALIFEQQSVSYRELNERANQLAHSLRAQGIGTDDLVGLCAERSPEMVIGMLGILKAGAAYVPLDPAYPTDRIAFMLKDSAVTVLVTQEHLLSDLPEHSARVLCLDRDRAELEREPATNPSWESSLDDLAYAIFTSGSTGTPKAALLTHRGLCNVSSEQRRCFGVGPGWRVLQFSSLSFDAATFEVVMALPNGASLCLGQRGDLLPGPDLIDFLRRNRINIVTLPPTALSACPPTDLPDLAVITVAGEACPAELVASWAPGRRFFNLYGPTEATIWSSIAELHAGDSSHIGRPVGNTQIHLLDEQLNVLPIGVPGELHIGGLGLARAYHNRPELSAERFIPNPFVPGERLYKSGDLARRRADGSIDYLGRIDHQVKLRGHRIELGEIEAVVDQHPAVRQSLVLVREDLPGDRRLVAYVVHAVDDSSPDDADADVDRERAQVEQWQTLYEQSYGDAPATDPEDRTFQIASWDSSYSGDAIDPEEMREWVDNTVTSVLATGPERVLEIGCGTGLILFRVAPKCSEYLGIDFSQAALDYVQAQLADVGLESKVRLEQRRADQLSDIPAGHFDTIVLNSVAQYFPSPEYLLRVLENAARLLRPGGRIFVGDVRNLALIEAFHTAIQRYRAPDDLDPGLLQQRIEQSLNQEPELLIDPQFFLAVVEQLPLIQSVSIEPKPGRYLNELSRFRYDVVLELAELPASADDAERIDWSNAGLNLAQLDQKLRGDGPDQLIIEDVPNTRTQADAHASELLKGDQAPQSLEQLARALAELAAEDTAADPQDFRDLCRDLPYACSVSWARGRADGRFDVHLQRRSPGTSARTATPAPQGLTRRQSWSEYGNQPLRNRLLAELVPTLREHVGRKLPAFMVPSAFVVLDAFPVTPNGKIDRRALPVPDSLHLELAEAYEAPRSQAEEALVEVWKQTLNVERVGVHDNFFELGGNSIQSIQIVAQARRLGLHFKAKDLFEHQTVAELAAISESSGQVQAEQGLITGPMPLTPIQHWFFELDLAAAHHFNQSFVLEAQRTLDPALLQAALGVVMRHHDGLRLRFSRGDEGWQQELVAPPEEVPLELHDLTTIPAEQRVASMQDHAGRLQASLDLTAGPLLRAALFHADGEQRDHLFLGIHHLAVDAVSWRVLLEDLGLAIEQLERGAKVHLPPKTTSMQAWSQRLVQYAQSDELAQAARYWLDLPWHAVTPVPVDRSGPPGGVGSLGSVSIELTLDQTRSLLQDVPRALGVQIHEALLWALAECVAQWTGTQHALLDVEGHGREDVLDGVDTSRTVGWFTSISPVLLELHPGLDLSAGLAAVQAQLRAVPERGFPYGAARYLAEDAAVSQALQRLPRAQIAFNYLGQVDQTVGAESAFRRSGVSAGDSRSPRNGRAHLLEVNGGVVAGQLRMTFVFDTQVHDQATMDGLGQRFAARLVELTEVGMQAPTRQLESSAADFGWSDDDIGDLLDELK